MNFVRHLFPSPKYLNFPIIGLDVSNRSIKYVELAETKNGIRLKRAGKKDLPEGTIIAGEIKKPDELSANISAFIKPLGVRYIVAALPEERAYISVMPVPKAEKGELREAIELGLPEKIPLPAGETTFDFELLSPPPDINSDSKIQEKNPTHNDAVIYAFPKTIANNYLQTYLDAGLEPASFKMETSALARAVIPENDGGHPVMLVDFGKTRTTFVIVAGGFARFSSTINVAGESLDKAIAKSLKVNLKKAEEIKRGEGMSRSAQNRAVFEAVLPIVSAIADEVERHILFWNTHAEHVHGQNPRISRAILAGGDSNLIGFKEYLSSKLALTVELANPWVNIAPFEKYIPEITLNESLAYSAAIGLALSALKDI